MQLINTLLALLPLFFFFASAAPVAGGPQTPFVAAVTGLPAAAYPNATYIAYAKNFFGDLTLQPTTDRSAALTWTVGPDCDLLSSGSNQTIALTPPYARPQAQSITYVAYNGSQDTYVLADGSGEVRNRSPDFGSWRFCESQYGAGLEYETPGFNNSNDGMPFPCYPVKFVLES